MVQTWPLVSNNISEEAQTRDVYMNMESLHSTRGEHRGMPGGAWALHYFKYSPVLCLFLRLIWKNSAGLAPTSPKGKKNKNHKIPTCVEKNS